MVIECENIILSIGQSIEWNNLLEDSKINLNPNQTAKADGFTYQTAEPDVFVGGDVFTGPRFAIDAIAAGKQGAISLHRFVHKGHDMYIGRDLRKYSEIDKNNLRIRDYDHAPRQIPERNMSAKPSFVADCGIFTEEQVKIETERCLGCGTAVVDETRCIGCGLCTTRCKFEAISLSKVSSKYGCTYEQLPLRIAGNVASRAGKIAVRSVKDVLRKE